MKQIFNLSHISAGFTAIIVGYSSSVILIIQAATAAGATAQQITSWLLALGLAMGISSIALSWYFNKPVLTAWSTPGAALLISVVGEHSMPVVIGAFFCSALLIILTGYIPIICRMLARIPAQLATAMLAAIVLPFCVNAFQPLQTQPVIAIIMLAGFLIAKRWLPRFSMLILLSIAIICAFTTGAFSQVELSLAPTQPIWVTPEFDLSAMLSIALPLYIVTMLSQNLPGLSLLKSYGYEVDIKPIFITTGVVNLLFAGFGALSVNLAAISAAICMNEDVDPQPQQRYRAAIWAGIFYLVAGLWAATVVQLFLSLPEYIGQMLAGLALIGTLLMCLQTAFSSNSDTSNSHYRDAAILTFIIGLSGINILGISAVLWGLLVGILHIKMAELSFSHKQG